MKLNINTVKSLLRIIGSLKGIHELKIKIRNIIPQKSNTLCKWSQDKSKWLMKLLMQDGDIETHPGPTELTLVTLNCRGLKNEEKLKQLLHRFTTSHDVTSNIIISLQETHLNYDTFKYR